MRDAPPRSRRRSQISYWLLIAAQWLLLTFAIAGGMVRGSKALRDYVSPSVGDGWLTGGALVAGLLLGLTVISPRVLVPLVISMCVVAAIVFGLIIYTPAWQGTLFPSTRLSNYAQQQALFLGLWTTVPAIIGALIGYLLAGSIRQALETRRDGADTEHLPWWERPSRSAAGDNTNS
ncbi:MAG TPA: hypothetical protein VFV93_01310 [Thermomicrobiales bacterium]|nr:hypothetical protein [Thermomicrobiales bacterium]